MTSTGQFFDRTLPRPHSVCGRRPGTADGMENAFRRYLFTSETSRPRKGQYHVKCGHSDYRRVDTPSIQDMEREKYSFNTFKVRPTSAPHRAKSTNRRQVPKSARPRTERGRMYDMKEEQSQRNFKNEQEKTEEDMFGLVKAAKEAKEFKEESEQKRSLDKARNTNETDEKKDVAPVFNKRLFASQGAVIITREARRLMNINASGNESCDLNSGLSKSELQCLRCVVDGLKLIHKGHDFVKDVLSKVVSYETYKPFEYVPTKSWEENLACYYILNGAVEVTYDLRSAESRNVYQANIIYSHGTGEYLGLVSPEGPTEDLTPPATIYTKEFTQFIRVDRQRFHQLMRKATTLIDQRKRNFISNHSFLAKVSEDVREKILHKLTIQEYPANRSILTQGDVSEYLYIVMKGRCQTYREVYIPEAEKHVLFYLTSRDPDDFFGEECVLEYKPSECTIVTATASVIMKLHRTALKMVQRDKLSRFIDEQRHENPSDDNLRDRGYRNSMWNKYKHTQIKGSLTEGGKLEYLSRPQSAMVRERPPEESDIYMENIRRFMLKGSMFQPLRAQSANDTGCDRNKGQQRRPFTALPGGLSTDNNSKIQPKNLEEKENVPGSSIDDVDGAPEQQSSLMTLEKAKEMEQNIAKHRRRSVKAMESKENLMKVLDEPDMTLLMKQAWKAEGTQETQNFMKNGVLVTMASEDIVRKAKALADSYVDKGKHTENEEEWDTILHAENKQAKMLISANKLRIKDIKRRLGELQKQRERDRRNNSSRRANYFSDDEDEPEENGNYSAVKEDGRISPTDTRSNNMSEISNDILTNREQSAENERQDNVNDDKNTSGALTDRNNDVSEIDNIGNKISEDKNVIQNVVDNIDDDIGDIVHSDSGIKHDTTKRILLK
ncbi:hypothetical protein ACF0H5_019930 [Mactra antiquata]